ncbi:MAG TPA: LacI family DNA-binding transcriptional regulator [Steroidobacteraceae bacterium]|nr:LacI family DNA-binding transcriptional regulator [Steroidobacteraceae bacterium]
MNVGKAPRRRGKAVTIHDVARKAGVSSMTVSRVTNAEDSVRDSTRDRVLRAIRELNYSPNPAARSLAGAQGTRIALIYSNPSESYLSALLVGTLEKASRMAVELVLEKWDNLRPAAERSAARKLAQSVAGVILPPPLCESIAITSELAAAGVPVVAVATGRFRANVCCVRIDDFRAASEMTAHLIALGHSRIGFIKGHPNQTASAQRLAGFQATMEESGLTPNPAYIQQGYFTYRSGLDAAERLLVRKRPPTAIFASNDDMAAAVISVAHRRGLDVPRDLSVVGFDDTVTATTVWPELTTIRQPIAAMGEAALDVLMRKIRRRKHADVADTTDHLFAHVLVNRDSDARPRRA